MKPRFALIVDHPLRDLSGLMLVARELSRMGAEVLLVPMYAQEREIMALAPDFVLMNYFRKNNEDFILRMHSCGIQYGLLDTEGGFYGDLGAYTRILSENKSVYEHARVNCIWGHGMLKVWDEIFPAFAKYKNILTGQPRFDFYAPSMRHLRFDFIPEAIRKKDKLVLLNTKVSLANPQYQTLDQEIRLYRDKLGFTEAEVENLLQLGRASIEDMVELARHVSKKFAAADVVLRPHPHENAKTYQERIQSDQPENLQVYREGSVSPWVLQAHATIHRHCTTAIESVLAGKAAIAPSWMRTSAKAPDAEIVSHHAHSWAELDELLAAALKGQLSLTNAMQTELNRIVDQWLFANDGQSFKRTADAIWSSFDTKQSVDKKKAQQSFYNFFATKRGWTAFAYDKFNRLSGAINPSLLWQLEWKRGEKLRRSQKGIHLVETQTWCRPLDQSDGATTNLLLARDSGKYLDHFPGDAIWVDCSN